MRQTQWAAQATATAHAAQATEQQAAINTTATANQQAYLLAVTQTAAIQQTLSTRLTQTANAAQTATAWPQTAIPLAATQQFIDSQKKIVQQRARWEQSMIPLKSALGLVVLLLLIVGGVAAYRRLMPVLELRLRTIPRGAHDAPLLVLPHLLIDPDRNFGPALLIDKDGAATTGLAPDLLLQERVTARDQAIDLARMAQPQKAAPKVARPVISGAAQPRLSSQISLPTIAPWQILKTWSGDGLPLGLGTQGLILANPEQHPHFLMAGTSGSGKTRFGLRILITFALASGWQVVIFDRSGLDYSLFQEYPNATLIVLDEPENASSYLMAAYAEIQRRFALLRDASVSTWSRMTHPGPRLLVVFDEFSNLADALSNKAREKLWRGARMVAAEGRKAGVHLALALQDPSHRSIDLRIRRNCTAISFRVQDQAASQVILGFAGAEQLPPRQFMTMVDGDATGPARGVAFAPEDEELHAFLQSHPVNAWPYPTWLMEPAQPSPPLLDERNLEIQKLHAQGASLNKIQRQLFGYTGGQAYEQVRQALDSNTTTT
ncbi:MAG: type IV secretion system DNA-binding domain-containing protein [Anaerolineae bacterium]|nr:type IV secretion system DNA-binding domain-containing protein [Anaerolineae bacterium]